MMTYPDEAAYHKQQVEIDEKIDEMNDKIVSTNLVQFIVERTW